MSRARVRILVQQPVDQAAKDIENHPHEEHRECNAEPSPTRATSWLNGEGDHNEDDGDGADHSADNGP
jgi:hypothetical protein